MGGAGGSEIGGCASEIEDGFVVTILELGEDPGS